MIRGKINIKLTVAKSRSRANSDTKLGVWTNVMGALSSLWDTDNYV
ncbi:MAG: hypothetical protein ABFD54_03030 [Armatimonadota bacterium]|nr:hypothetical protein [bacterium]